MRYKVNPDIIFKVTSHEVHITFLNSKREEIYTFEGPSSILFKELLNKTTIDFSNFQMLTEQFQSTEEDVKKLWDFCLREEILIIL